MEVLIFNYQCQLFLAACHCNAKQIGVLVICVTPPAVLVTSKKVILAQIYICKFQSLRSMLPLKSIT